MLEKIRWVSGREVEVCPPILVSLHHLSLLTSSISHELHIPPQEMEPYSKCGHQNRPLQEVGGKVCLEPCQMWTIPSQYPIALCWWNQRQGPPQWIDILCLHLKHAFMQGVTDVILLSQHGLIFSFPVSSLQFC
jgi:hypothetical protein